jgi:hypothetical protein
MGQDVFLDAQLAFIEGERLVAQGIALDPEAWEEHKVSVGFTTVRRALLAWDLGALRFRPAAEYATASLGRGSVGLLK